MEPAPLAQPLRVEEETEVVPQRNLVAHVDQRPAIQGVNHAVQENQTRQRVVLLGQTVQRALFENEEYIGQTIKINRVSFQVLGVLPSLGSNAFRDQDDIVVIPLMTAMKRIMGKNYLDQIDVEISDLKEMSVAQEEINQLIIQGVQL